jgi:hypothetical protein
MTNSEKEAVMQNANWLIEDVLRLEKFTATHDGDIKSPLCTYLLSIEENVAALKRVINNSEKNNNKL